MATSLQASLSSLTEREGVADALYRMVESFDNNDFDLLKSASVSDISVDLNGTVFDNLEAIRTQLLAGVGPMVSTSFSYHCRKELHSQKQSRFFRA